MRLGLGLAALGLAAALCLSGAAARDRIESEDRWATAVNTLKRKTRRLQADDGKKTTRASRRLGSPKQLVDTAHPLLKARWEATGKLTLADIEAAAAAPEWRTERAVRGRDRVSRLGSINDDRTAADCAAYTGSGAACFDGDQSYFDDDFVVALAPGACATCGYSDSAPSGGNKDFRDCITCADAAYEIIVLFDDCTGVCVDTAGKATLEGMGFADLDDSACEATRACYDDDNFVDSLWLGGANTNFIDGGGDEGDACLDDCSFTIVDDEVGWDCAGFTDIASSCLADCDASLANDFAFHCAEMYTKTYCYAERTAAKTCACAELNVCDDSGITGYSLPSDAVNHGATNGGLVLRGRGRLQHGRRSRVRRRGLLGPLRAQVPRLARRDRPQRRFLLLPG